MFNNQIQEFANIIYNKVGEYLSINKISVPEQFKHAAESRTMNLCNEFAVSIMQKTNGYANVASITPEVINYIISDVGKQFSFVPAHQNQPSHMQYMQSNHDSVMNGSINNGMSGNIPPQQSVFDIHRRVDASTGVNVPHMEMTSSTIVDYTPQSYNPEETYANNNNNIEVDDMSDNENVVERLDKVDYIPDFREKYDTCVEEDAESIMSNVAPDKLNVTIKKYGTDKSSKYRYIEWMDEDITYGQMNDAVNDIRGLISKFKNPVKNQNVVVTTHIGYPKLDIPYATVVAYLSKLKEFAKIVNVENVKQVYQQILDTDIDSKLFDLIFNEVVDSINNFINITHTDIDLPHDAQTVSIDDIGDIADLIDYDSGIYRGTIVLAIRDVINSMSVLDTSDTFRYLNNRRFYSYNNVREISNDGIDIEHEKYIEEDMKVCTYIVRAISVVYTTELDDYPEDSAVVLDTNNNIIDTSRYSQLFRDDTSTLVVSLNTGHARYVRIPNDTDDVIVLTPVPGT